MRPDEYSKIAPELKMVYESRHALHDSFGDKGLVALVELYVSFINNCSYCIDLHISEAKSLNVNQNKIDAAMHDINSEIYSDREKIAFQWAKLITNLADKNSPEYQKFTEERALLSEKMGEFFSKKEIVDLTAIISLMNCLNRMAVCMYDIDC
jgi:AhpD family alkylhydroperoxidase